MTPRAILAVGAFLCAITAVYCQTPTSSAAGATTSSSPISTVPSDVDDFGPQVPNIYDSQAINAQDVCPGYTASNIVKTPYGFTADLILAGAACNVYGTDVEALNLTIEYQSDDRLHIEIIPSYVDSTNSSWYILPEELVSKPSVDANSVTPEYDLDFSWSNDPTFSFQIIRQSTKDILFDTTGTRLVFENQFIEFVSALPENYNLYGLGEVIHGLRMGNNFTRTIYAADIADPIDYNLYGSHSFYLDTRYFEVDQTNGDLTYSANANNPTVDYVSYSHGVYLRNSHGQEVLMRPSNITWRTIGGSIDLYFYAGPTQEKVTKSYETSTVGLPAMQQYWTLGFHQCRWGYSSWAELQDVVDNFAKSSIPLETIWTDIDYMNQYRDFENDQENFGYTEGAIFLSQIHANGQHYVPIVDSAIYVPNPDDSSDVYPTFTRGYDADSFMLNPDGSLYIGQVWPGYTSFPDFIGGSLNGTSTFEWWTGELSLWYENIKFDGIWIDMNEVSSFCEGSCGSYNISLNPVRPPFSLPGEPGNEVFGYPEGFNLTNATEYFSVLSVSLAVQPSTSTSSVLPAETSTKSNSRTHSTPGTRDILDPPYMINNVQGALDVHAVSPNATHRGGIVEYDVHNLFGHQILNATYHSLLSLFPTKRPFVIGRSTFAGSGKWAGHWGGDNTSLWAFMFFSIPQALSFSLFGIPMFGVDTCGFQGNTDEELCNRWMQLSAFFPFYRNHNINGAISQEPYVWESVAEASRTAMAIRYSLLPYMYTSLYLAHSTGSTVMRALAWEFPNDPSLADADHQFLLGPGILVTPVLAQGATTVNGVFPGVGKGEVWYDWYNQSQAIAGPGQNVTIDAPLGHIPVYIRGGSVLPIQEPGMTIKECRGNPWAIIAASGGDGKGSGELYIDDGESLNPIETLWVNFSLQPNSLSATPKGAYKDTNPLANITILGVSSSPSSVQFNAVNVGASGWTWNKTSKALAVTSLANSTSSGSWSQDWVLKWS